MPEPIVRRWSGPHGCYWLCRRGAGKGGRRNPHFPSQPVSGLRESVLLGSSRKLSPASSSDQFPNSAYSQRSHGRDQQAQTPRLSHADLANRSLQLKCFGSWSLAKSHCVCVCVHLLMCVCTRMLLDSPTTAAWQQIHKSVQCSPPHTHRLYWTHSPVSHDSTPQGWSSSAISHLQRNTKEKVREGWQ